MPLILESYDAEAETTLLSKAQDDLPAGTSLVGLVDNEKQTLLNIQVGLNDQEIMHEIVRLWSYAANRYVTPGEQLPKKGLDPVDSYQKICDALLKLKSPVLYRKAERESKDGYLIDSATLQTILDAAKKEVFANVRLAGCVSYCKTVSYAKDGNPVTDFVYESVKVEFNREPWEPPVSVAESLSVPQNFFQKLRSLLTRS